MYRWNNGKKNFNNGLILCKFRRVLLITPNITFYHSLQYIQTAQLQYTGCLNKLRTKQGYNMKKRSACLTFKRRIKSHLPFAGVIFSTFSG